MARLLLLFVVVPIVELLLLIEIGRIVGTPATILLILVTGVLGATLARRQGTQTWRRVRTEMSAGRVPADALGDGALILVAGAVLMTPGVLTDILGFSLLVPRFRRWIKALVRRRFERAVEQGRVKVSVAGQPGWVSPARGESGVKNVTPGGPRRERSGTRPAQPESGGHDS